MDLNQTPLANRTHIAFFGIRNAGKSSIMNALTNQNIAVVSPVKGTTTDPVHKAMELLPLGPVNIIDTAGLDDIGELGKLRIEKTKQILNKTDIAILVIDATLDFTDFDRNILKLITDKNIPYRRRACPFRRFHHLSQVCHQTVFNPLGQRKPIISNKQVRQVS